jgi:mutual gliding-motility protein MglA
MVLISYSGREINAKLVYYGPGLSGKTTNLEYIYGAIPQTHRGKMVSMKTKTERTLFFDFLPIDLGELSGFKTRFLLYTVPGQVYYNATRKLVLKGVDAIVFVADSKRGKMEENLESLQNLRDNLKEQGLDLDKMPWVIQYNKRDLPDVYSIEELDRTLNPSKRILSFEAVGTTGVGVFETFKSVSKLLLQHLSKEIGVRVVTPAAAPQPIVAPPAAQAPSVALPPIVAPPAARAPLVAPPPIAMPAAAPAAPSPVAPPPTPSPDASETAVPPVALEQPSMASAGVGDRLRRWLYRSREPNDSFWEADSAPEAPSAVPTADSEPDVGPPSVEPDADPDLETFTQPFVEPIDEPPPVNLRAVGSGPATAGPPLPEREPLTIEVPVTIDLDPSDLDREIVLKLRIRVEERRARAA